MTKSVRVGIRVICSICGRPKAPIGRSISDIGASSYCTYFECVGYSQQPFSGSLFPGETETEFGYPVSDDGTVFKEIEVEK
jgi:hypothetical protein